MSLILNLEQDDLLFTKEYLNLGELYTEITKLLEQQELTDGKPEAVAAWKDKTNFLIDMYNSKSSFKKFDKV